MFVHADKYPLHVCLLYSIAVCLYLFSDINLILSRSGPQVAISCFAAFLCVGEV